MEDISNILSHVEESILRFVAAKYIYLFGSHAYGQPHEDSDIDIYLVVPDDAGNLTELYTEIICDLSLKDIFFIDLKLNRESNFNFRKDRFTLEETIINKGRLLYEDRRSS